MDLDRKIATRQSYGEKLAELGKENKKFIFFLRKSKNQKTGFYIR